MGEGGEVGCRCFLGCCCVLLCTTTMMIIFVASRGLIFISVYVWRQTDRCPSQSVVLGDGSGKKHEKHAGRVQVCTAYNAKKSDGTATTMYNAVEHVCTVTHKAHLLHRNNSSLTRQSLNSIDRRGRTLCVCGGCTTNRNTNAW